MKMRALLRYRRIPHLFEMRNGAVSVETAQVKPQIIPMLQFPDDDAWRVDSTPMAYELEERFPNHRSVLPADPVQRFFSDFIEDFADEWLTKAMFHYRWFYAADRDFAGGWIAADNVVGANAQGERREFAERIAARQVSRMALVGCTAENRPVIERSFERLIDAMEPSVGFGQYLFGTRPSLADFALFGQLRTLGDDPTGLQIMRQRAPTLVHWCRQTDDLSGLEGEWLPSGTDTPPLVQAILSLAAETYLPFMHANYAALQAGVDEIDIKLMGNAYRQAPFRYQAKTYSRLRSLYERLTGAHKEQADTVLDAAACAAYFKV
jgi:glutathione S-transferase